MNDFLATVIGIIKDILSGFGIILGYIFIIFKFIIWAVFGVLIFICVFVATHWYPRWEKWSESLKRP